MRLSFFHDLTERTLNISKLPYKSSKIRNFIFNLEFHRDDLSIGVPVPEESNDATTINATTFGPISMDPEIQGHSMDDILPGTKAPPSPVLFVNVPEHTETELGSSVLLACRTANPVAECQWSWQPLPPVHLPLPDISETPATS